MLRIKSIKRLLHINEYFIFYPRLKRFYKAVLKKSDPVIIDVGCNKGQTIDFFLKHFPKSTIYGFEPNRDLFDFLCKKYKGNRNITLTNCGISNQKGKLVFNETVTDETSTFEELNMDSEYLKMKSKVLGIKPENMITKSYEVEVITLSDFIQEKKVANIDVLKIDTEGHEYKCLLGLFSGAKCAIGYIQLEQHNDDMYANKPSNETIDELLKSNSYRLYQTIKHGFGDFDEVIYKI